MHARQKKPPIPLNNRATRRWQNEQCSHGIHRLRRTLAIDDSTAATSMLNFFRRLGVGITEANERDVAIAFGELFGRWAPLPLRAEGAPAAPSSAADVVGPPPIRWTKPPDKGEGQ
jgi:hypothetical protein